jgi:hypothetical protein
MPVSRKNRSMKKSSRSRNAKRSKTMKRMRGGNQDNFMFTDKNIDSMKLWGGVFKGVKKENNDKDIYYIINIKKKGVESKGIESYTEQYDFSNKYFTIYNSKTMQMYQDNNLPEIDTIINVCYESDTKPVSIKNFSKKDGYIYFQDIEYDNPTVVRVPEMFILASESATANNH